MKLTRKEFEQQLALAKSLPVAARAAMIAILKSASVVEVDDKGVETPVTVEIIEEAPAAAAAGAAAPAAPAATAAPAAPAAPVAPAAKAADPAGVSVKSLVDHAIATANANRPGSPLGAPADLAPTTKAFTIPAEIRRTRVKNFGAKSVGGFEPDERAFRFGMWCLAIRGSEGAKSYCAQHGIGIIKAQASDDLIIKLQSEGVNSAGGFLVPEEVKTDIIELKETFGVARRLFNNEPMTSDRATRPRRRGGLTAYPVGEGKAGTESTTSWDQVSLTAKDWMVLTRMTNQLSADSIISWADKLAAEVSYAFTLAEDQAAFNGDGSAAVNGVTGLLPKLLNTFTTGGGPGLIVQSGNSGWDNLVLGDFDKAVGALPQYADTPGAVWVCHRTFYYSVIEKLIQASGGVPAMEIRDGNRRPRPIFKGYPVEFSQVFPAASGAGQIPITLGDHALAADFGDRQQDQIAFSDQASINGESLWERNETGVRGIERFDVNVHDVGNAAVNATGGNPAIAAAAGPVVGVITK